MKKLLLACSLVGIIAGANAHPATNAPAPGQHSHTAHSHPEQCSHKGQCPHKMMKEGLLDPAERAAQLQKKLQLSDEQTAKVKKVFEDSTTQRTALKEKYKPQFEAFHGDIRKLREQTHTQLNGILTPKQKEALEAQRKTHGGEMCEKDMAHDR